VSAAISTERKVAIGASTIGIGAGLLGAFALLSGYAWRKKDGTKMTILERTFASLVTQLIEHIEKLETEAEELRKRPTKASFDSLAGDNNQHIREIASVREQLTTQRGDVATLRRALDDANAEIAKLRDSKSRKKSR
jgi:septal ring factor EnvC (AmiA/AmiB activator)